MRGPFERNSKKYKETFIEEIAIGISDTLALNQIAGFLHSTSRITIDASKQKISKMEASATIYGDMS